MVRRAPSLLATQVLTACRDAGGQWVTINALYAQYGCDPKYYGHGNGFVDDAIQHLVEEGRIQRDYGKRRVRLTAGPVEPAPEAPTRIKMITDLIRRAPLTEAEAEEIRALLPPARE